MPPLRVFEQVKDFFFAQIRGWRQLKDVQEDIARIYHHHLTIRRLKFWIMRRKHGQEPGTEKNIHYWSVW